MDVLLNDPDSEMRDWAAKAIACSLGGQEHDGKTDASDPETLRLLSALIHAAIYDPSQRVNCSARVAIEKGRFLNVEAVSSTIQEALVSKDHQVRARAEEIMDVLACPKMAADDKAPSDDYRER